ncbi:hypothetical protein E6O51_19520 [Pseudothauera rhizosphaerae]|uniref:Uncharacterized protein n=1 Tax=Pseudothauera rhizosphaerae TaxID=2565932 RepID=A0A4S4AB67_9RHOO|nr:hypothetical protein E6O51_19520 [Pseudothauera rhizosphaerae]
MFSALPSATTSTASTRSPSRLLTCCCTSSTAP